MVLCYFGEKIKKVKKEGKTKLITHPNNRAYTNFFNNLIKCEEEYKEIFEKLVKYMEENIEEFGEKLAGDGKIIESYATKPPKKEDGRRDLDADYTQKQYLTTTDKGEKIIKKKTYFGFRVHAIVDINTELPVAIGDKGIKIVEGRNAKINKIFDDEA